MVETNGGEVILKGTVQKGRVACRLKGIEQSRAKRRPPMNLRSLIPSGNGATRTSPSANPFGSLHREIDRLFEDFTRGLDVGGPGPVNLVPSIDVSESDS